MFVVMGLDKVEVEEKFGFLLEVFMFGVLLYGGIVFGWDWIIVLLVGMDLICEVIVFLKIGGGVDLFIDVLVFIIV